MSAERATAQSVERERPPSVGIDLMRGLAALFVACSHLRGLTLLDYASLPASDRNAFSAAFYAVTRLGHEAVIVFFVLSGFLVGGNAIQNAISGRFRANAFLIDRVTRIFIPLAAAVVITAFVIFLHGGKPPSLSQLLANILGLNGVWQPTLRYNSALWSIAYETFFYWLLLAVVLLFSSRPAARIMCIASLLTLLVLFAALDFRYLLIWCFGAAAFLVRSTIERIGYFAVGAFCFLAGVVAYQAQLKSNAYQPGSGLSASQAEVLLAFGVAIALPYLGKIQPTHCGAVSKLAAFLAGISFSLYLTHLPLIGVFELLDASRSDLSPANLGELALKLFLVLCFAWVFSQVFERGSYRIRRLVKERFVR